MYLRLSNPQTQSYAHVQQEQLNLVKHFANNFDEGTIYKIMLPSEIDKFLTHTLPNIQNSSTCSDSCRCKNCYTKFVSFIIKIMHTWFFQIYSQIGRYLEGLESITYYSNCLAFLSSNKFAQSFVQQITDGNTCHVIHLKSDITSDSFPKTSNEWKKVRLLFIEDYVFDKKTLSLLRSLTRGESIDINRRRCKLLYPGIFPCVLHTNSVETFWKMQKSNDFNPQCEYVHIDNKFDSLNEFISSSK